VGLIYFVVDILVYFVLIYDNIRKTNVKIQKCGHVEN